VTAADDLTEIAWMIEELRVSLFERSPGAAQAVSERRVLQAIDAAAKTVRASPR